MVEARFARVVRCAFPRCGRGLRPLAAWRAGRPPSAPCTATIKQAVVAALLNEIEEAGFDDGRVHRNLSNAFVRLDRTRFSVDVEFTKSPRLA